MAVDIVLLPSEKMMDKAIEANRELLKQCTDKITLNKKDCLPHISVGYGEITGLPSPIEFRATQLALCHLGNHCTCRKVLASAEFST